MIAFSSLIPPLEASLYDEAVASKLMMNESDSFVYAL